MLVGTGISDITGPIAEVVMMGYAESDQKAAGLHTRLYARAFIFAIQKPTSASSG
jgi:neutral ceramidase